MVASGSKVVSLTMGPLSEDPRVRKNALWLREQGWDIAHFSYDKGFYNPTPEPATYVGKLDDCPLFLIWGNHSHEVGRVVTHAGPEVVHCHELESLYLYLSRMNFCMVEAIRGGKTAKQAGMKFAKPGPAKIVYDSHEYEQNRRFVGVPPQYIEDRKWREEQMMPFVDAIITPTESITAKLQEQFGKPTYTVPNCTPRPARALRKGHLREVLSRGLPPEQANKPIVVFSGNLTPARRLDIVHEAASRAGCLLVLIGRWLDAGDSIAPIRNRLVQAKDVVVFPWQPYPYVDVEPIMLDLISGADVAVHLTDGWVQSYEMSLGNKVFEYAMSGVPCVVPQHLKENAALIEKYGTGSSCPVELEALVNQFKYWVANPPDPQCFENFNADWSFGSKAGPTLDKVYAEL